MTMHRRIFMRLMPSTPARVNVRTLKIIHGKFPRRAFALVKAWAEQHQSELLENWELCRKHIPPRTIQPLR